MLRTSARLCLFSAIALLIAVPACSDDGGSTTTTTTTSSGPGGAGGTGGAGGQGGAAGTGGQGGMPLVCDPGTVDCDMNPANGCEVLTTSDAANCGTCGNDCNGGSCVAGGCVAVTDLVTGQEDPSYLAIAGGLLFWTNFGDDSVAQSATDGTSQAVLAAMQAGPAGIAADLTHVYWVNHGASSGNDGSILEAPVDGSAPPAPIAENVPYPWGVAIDDSFVYWTHWEGGGGVIRAPRGSMGQGPFTTIATGDVPNNLAVDDTHVYWVLRTSGTVRRAPKDGLGQAETLAQNQGEVREIAVDATHVYWTTSASGTVMKSPKEGGGQVEPVAVAQANPRMLAADATGVYWANAASGTVMRAAPDGQITAVAAGLPSPWGLAIDETYVYWTNQVSGGSIQRALKVPDPPL